jgi:hypothetical protein
VIGVLLGNYRMAVEGCLQVSEKVKFIKIAAKPCGQNIINLYVPNVSHRYEEVETFYEQVDSVRKECKAEDVSIVIRDLNAKVGMSCSGSIVGNFVLGEK